MDFQITEEHVGLQQRCRQLAEDFATRAAWHDREATDPVENYALLRQAGFYALNVPKELGGWGMGLLGYALAAEELAQGCPATALAFNMHPCMVGPLMESPLVTMDVKQRLARLVVRDQQLLAGNLSERADHLSSARHLHAHGTRLAGRWRLSHHGAQGVRLDD
jgi:alkylation response protein AidB-like acyl-CoA dehydrogenase